MRLLTARPLCRWPVYALAAWLALEIICLVSVFADFQGALDDFDTSRWELRK